MKDMWEDLENIVLTMEEGWLLGGDFNDILTVDEKQGGTPASRRKCNKF